MSIYRCPVDGGYSSYESLKKRYVVAQGWSASDDVSFFLEEDNIAEYLPVFALKKDLDKVNTVFNLLTRDAKPGDIFVATNGGEICGICELPENFTYVYLPDDEYANCLFPVKWIDWKDFCNEFCQISNPRSRGPFTRINNSNVAEFVNSEWDSYKKKKSIVLQPSECQADLEKYIQDRPEKISLSRNNFQRRLNMLQNQNNIESFVQLLKNCQNLILTGAPGTGKTYLAREIAYALTGDTAENHPHVGFCQFHPSYDYTDFVEGIRPCENETTGVQFSRRNGIFKDFCISALKGTTQNSQDNFEDVWNKLVSILEEKRYLDIPLLTGNASFLIEMNEYGTGLANRTYANDDAKQRGEWINGQSKFFSKDQLYNIYRGLPGIPSGGHDNYRKAVVKFLKANYGLKDYKPGSETPQDTQQPFVFIIDEINRGDISKIFGELFFALDPGYRGKKGAIKTQYANLAPADDPFKDGFYIPKNVFVIGTMNDIDRGVESMDFAIRRRFTWIQVKPEDRLSMWNDNLSSDIIEEADKRMRSLNMAIAEEEVLGPAYQIGPAYFLKLADYKSSAFENLWSWHIEPLIEEYLRGIPDAKQIKQKLYKKYQLIDEVSAEN